MKEPVYRRFSVEIEEGDIKKMLADYDVKMTPEILEEAVEKIQEELCDTQDLLERVAEDLASEYGPE
jgi:hypothetical protein